METIDKLKFEIKEQEELLELIKYDLRNTEITRKKIGSTAHLDEMVNLYLDQFQEITKKIKSLENKLDMLQKGYNLFPEKIKNERYEKRNKKRN